MFGNVAGSGHHTVIALAGNGAAATVRASPFKLVPTADRFTLQIRGEDGTYEGPVVAAGTGKKLVMGLRAGARLGSVVRRGGYFILRRTPKRRFLANNFTATGTRGAPIGAGSLGLVGSTPRGKGGRGQDQDHDGVPGVFDVDVDGDRILNNVDVARTARSAASAEDAPLHASWLLNVGLKQGFLADQMGLTQGIGGYALNQNAINPSTSEADFEKLRDLALRIRGSLVFTLPPGDEIELDCGGLSYCSGPFSTGTDITQMLSFPRQFDKDGDGFGTMIPTKPPFNPQRDGFGTTDHISPNTPVFVLKPGAPASEIGAGDSYLLHVSNNGVETSQQPVMLNYVFGTVPAMAAWSDSTRSVKIAYPVPSHGDGTEENAFQTPAYPNGVLTFSIWRPQRQAIPGSGEGSGWVDVGHLLYTVAGFQPSFGDRVWKCPDSAYTTSDPNLVLQSGGLRDRANDGPVDPSRTLTFSVDIAACLRHSGIDPTQEGHGSTIFFTAASDFGDATEGGGFSFEADPSNDPSRSHHFGGTWRYASGSPDTHIEWTVKANDFATQRFGVKVFRNSIATATAPPGWNCELQSQAATDDLFYCTGSTLPAGSSVSGTLELKSPDVSTVAFEAVAPTAADSANDTGYPLSQAP